MKGWGQFLIIVGVICAFSAIKMDTSVATGLGERVNNLGLMNLQTNLLIGAGIAFISGILLIGFNSKSEAGSSEAIRTCPYCAEWVKAQAIICRFCQKDLPVLNPDELALLKTPNNDRTRELLDDDEIQKKLNLSSRIGCIAIILVLLLPLFANLLG